MKLVPPRQKAETDSEQVLRQISTLIDAPVHWDEPLHRGLVSDIGVVQAGVQHDDRKWENVARVCWKEITGVNKAFLWKYYNLAIAFLGLIIP